MYRIVILSLSIHLYPHNGSVLKNESRQKPNHNMLIRNAPECRNLYVGMPYQEYFLGLRCFQSKDTHQHQ